MKKLLIHIHRLQQNSNVAVDLDTIDRDQWVMHILCNIINIREDEYGGVSYEFI